MSAFHVASGVILLVAVFGYFNHRFFKLPEAIGITAIGMVASLAAVIAGSFDHAVIESAKRLFLHSYGKKDIQRSTTFSQHTPTRITYKVWPMWQKTLE